MPAKGSGAPGATANPTAATSTAPKTATFDDDTSPATPRRAGSSSSSPRGGSSSGLQNGSGILLGFVLWVWVALPYLDGGRERVAAVLRAKLTNRAADGSPLP